VRYGGAVEGVCSGDVGTNGICDSRYSLSLSLSLKPAGEIGPVPVKYIKYFLGISAWPFCYTKAYFCILKIFENEIFLKIL